MTYTHFLSNDLEKSTKFYQHALGFSETSRQMISGTVQSIEVRKHDVTITLHSQSEMRKWLPHVEPSASFVVGNGGFLAVHLRAVPEVLAAVENFGGKILTNNHLIAFSSVATTISDPDGHILALTHSIEAESPSASA